MNDIINKNNSFLIELISSSQLSFDSNLHTLLPESHGIYRIFEIGSGWKSTLRAGKTRIAQDGLKQRIYNNHYMGNQNGNIRQQLINIGMCQNLEEAKNFLEQKCKVQFLVIEDSEDRKWAEYYMLSILHPILCD